MSDERERSGARAADAEVESVNPGAPVEESSASETEVLAAVERASGGSSVAADETGGGSPEAVVENGTGGAEGAAEPSVSGSDATANTPEEAELARREASAQVDTQLDLPRLDADQSASAAQQSKSVKPNTEELAALPPILDDLPTAAAEPETQLQPERDGEIRISADHPMAALYMQTPMPPDVKGNRGAGVLISFVATLGFVLVLAAAVSVWLLPTVGVGGLVDGLLEVLPSWSFGAAAAAFFLGLVLLVLIVGRAGWWAYVLGGFFVGIVVWVAATLGSVVDSYGFGALVHLSPTVIVERFGFTVSAVGAGIIAREASVWFGAWIGRRGRKVKLANAAAMQEYEEALAEAKSKQASTRGAAVQATAL